MSSVRLSCSVAVPGPTSTNSIPSHRLARSPAHIASALRRAISSGLVASGLGVAAGFFAVASSLVTTVGSAQFAEPHTNWVLLHLAEVQRRVECLGARRLPAGRACPHPRTGWPYPEVFVHPAGERVFVNLGLDPSALARIEPRLRRNVENSWRPPRCIPRIRPQSVFWDFAPLRAPSRPGQPRIDQAGVDLEPQSSGQVHLPRRDPPTSCRGQASGAQRHPLLRSRLGSLLVPRPSARR